MFQRFCTNPRLGFETTDDYPCEGVSRLLSTDWSHCHRDDVIRYLVNMFSEFRDKKDFMAAIAKNINGPAYPCMGTIQSHLLRNQDKPDGKDVVYHTVLIVGADLVASESAFSVSGRVISSRRSKLTPVSVETCICLKDYLDGVERIQHISPLEGELERVKEEIHLEEILTGMALPLPPNEDE
ncbi:hypothetical protein CTI12_AA250570 [Artemisia annua]|uniref:HAT C-terminal dimerisation domain-containing protein n=1 Tax=Artemisia annua TaxID=35608 RepID=A0A2U1NM84_ARTAN|nr:hypothetical protein CTI12_AA250570 [Artemisia annua]